MTPTKRFRIQGITGSANEFKHTAIVQCRALKCASKHFSLPLYSQTPLKSLEMMHCCKCFVRRFVLSQSRTNAPHTSAYVFFSA